MKHSSLRSIIHQLDHLYAEEDTTPADTRFPWRGILLLSLVVCGISFLLYEFALGRCYLNLQGQVERQMGFTYTTPVVEGTFFGKEVFEVWSVTAGKPFARAGVQAHDWIRFHSVSDLFYLLIFHQGETVILLIERNGRSLDISIDVPLLQLDYSAAFRRWLYRGELSKQGQG